MPELSQQEPRHPRLSALEADLLSDQLTGPCLVPLRQEQLSELQTNAALAGCVEL